jgi:ParB family chromosome partitioning protein
MSEEQPMLDKKTRKKEIGKGIRALLSTVDATNVPKEEKIEAQKVLNSTINEIPIESVSPNPFQPRNEWDDALLEELATSIKALGIIQPITVRALGPNSYQLISGERRYRASKLAGLKTIPAYVRTAGDQEMLEMALVENIQRADLNAIEVAISYQRLIQECNLTHEALSDRVGKNRSTITNYTRLLKLAPDIQDAIRHGKLSMGHARSLVGVNDIMVQRQVFKDTLENGWSVRELERHLRNLEAPPKKSSPRPTERPLAPALRDIEMQLTKHLEAKVSLEHKNTGAGRIVIPYNDEDDLHRLLELLQED